MEKDDRKLNPEIAKVNIGTRELREITIYPLSLADQMNMEAALQEGFQGALRLPKEGAEADVATFSLITDIIKARLPELLGLITGEEKPDAMMAEITNNQAVEIAETVYRQNYELLRKKVSSLFEGKSVNSLLERLSQVSSDDIPNTGLKTSTESPSGKGD